MASPGSSRVSAFQMFSTVTKVSSDKSSNKETEELITPKRKQNPKATSEPRKYSTAPKSLIAMVKQSDEKIQKPLDTHKRNNSNPKQKRSNEGNAKSDGGPVKSLLDISFDDPALQIDHSFHPGQDQEGNGRSRGLLKRHASMKQHSYSETNVSHKKQLLREAESLPSSMMKPLVVEMQTGNKTAHLSSPKPLLDFSTIDSLKNKKPLSLMDLSQQRREKVIPQVTHITRSKVVLSQQLNDSGKKKMEETTVKSAESEETHSDSDGLSTRKKGKFEHNQFSKKIQTCQGKDCYFLIIPASCSWLHLQGKAQVCVEQGIVSIMAYTLQPKVTFDIFSPSAGCLLAMHVDSNNKILASDVKTEMSRLCGQESDNLMELGDDTIAIIRVRQLKSRVCDYLTSFTPFTQLFKIPPPREHERSDTMGVTLVDLGLKVAPQSEMTHTCMNWSPEYNNALEKWSRKFSLPNAERQGPVLLTCGGKNSGKSILNRCAINVALESVEAVAYLDCDVGQTEFSPPATLSLHIIRRPVLGLPFCHQRHAEKMVFFGDVTPTQDPDFYVRCIKYVIQAYASLASKTYLPLIVNTMGFPEGVGLMLFIDTMNIVRPDLVIQLDSVIQYTNFPAVTQEMVALDEGWTFNKCPPEDPGKRVAETKAHELILLSSLASPKRDFSLKLQPLDLRNLALLSSLFSGLEKDMTLASVTPFIIPYKDIAVHVCHCKLSPKELLIAINASVISLCETDLSQATKDEDHLPWLFHDVPICHSVGLGFVRAVDMTRGLLLVVTTLPRAMLRKVNAVLKGSLTLPDHFYLNQRCAKPLPYVDALAPSTAVAAVKPRARMPRVTINKN